MGEGGAPWADTVEVAQLFVALLCPIAGVQV